MSENIIPTMDAVKRGQLTQGDSNAYHTHKTLDINPRNTLDKLSPGGDSVAYCAWLIVVNSWGTRDIALTTAAVIASGEGSPHCSSASEEVIGCFSFSDEQIYLPLQAEHHERDLANIPGATVYREPGHDRAGVLTTSDSKHQMCAMTNSMLREGRMHVLAPLFSRDPATARARMREQLGIYSYQFKGAATTFGRDQAALSGKVGGMKDDVCICLQIGVLYTSPGASVM